MDATAGPVVGVLEADEAGADVVLVPGAEFVAEVCKVNQAAVGIQRAGGHSPVAGDTACLPDVDVGAGVAEQLIAGLGMNADGDLVGHRARGDEEGGLLAEQLGHLAFQGDDRGVLAVDVVADLGLGHRPSHRGGRFRDGVGAKVDGW